MTNRPRHYKPRAEKPSKKAALAALNAFRPLDAPEFTAERKKPRRFKEDSLDGFGEAARPVLDIQKMTDACSAVNNLTQEEIDVLVYGRIMG